MGNVGGKKIYRAAVPVDVESVVVPIVFIPGLMATRLRKKGGGKTIWDPDDPIWMLRNFTRGTKYDSSNPYSEPSIWDVKNVDMDYNKVRSLIGFDENPEAEPIKESPGTSLNEYEYDDEKNRGFPRKYNNDEMKRGFAECFASSYEKLLREMDKEFFTARRSSIKKFNIMAPVEVIGYDWRNYPDKIVEYVENRFTEKKEKNDPKYEEYLRSRYDDEFKFIIVTHSMGGLIARKLLQKNKKLEERCLGVIHGDQPVIGAPKSYGFFKKGAESVNFEIVSENKRSASISDRILSNAQGNTAIDFQYVASSMPGALILLPTDDYKLRDENGKIDNKWITWKIGSDKYRKPIRDNIGDGPVDGISKNISIYKYYKEPGYIGLLGREFYKKYPLIVEKFSTNLKEAEEFHKQIGTGDKIYAHPVTYEISVRDVNTIVGVNLEEIGEKTEDKDKKEKGIEPDGLGVKLIFSPDGDETVPLYSQKFLSEKYKDKIKNKTFSKTEHQDVYNNNDIRQYVVDKIEELLLGIFTTIYFDQGK